MVRFKSKRRGKFISDLEDKTTNKITASFNKMMAGFKGITKIAFGKNNGGSPIDMLVELGFEEIQQVLEGATITTYAFAYQAVSNTLVFDVNLDRVNKQALREIQLRKEFAQGMSRYTKLKLYSSLEQALKGDITYEEYLKEADDIFALSKDRARKIAINEIGSVYVDATANAVRDFQMQTNAKVKKKWNSVNDDRVTEGCKYNESLGYVSQDFIYPDVDGLGGGESPPRFIGCRCALDYEVED
jgi:hypothetical protein